LGVNDLGYGVYCIDTDYQRPGLAACYLIREGDRLGFVDTGTAQALPRLLDAVAALGLTTDQVDYVIPTHVHLDHAGGAGDLMAVCPNARLVAHPNAAPHLIDPSRLTAGATAVYGEEAFARDFGRITPVSEARVLVAEDGIEVDLNGRTLTFIDTPGHANHHGCVLDSRSQGIFTGDTFGIAYKDLDTARGPLLFAPTTPVAFDPEAWQRSLDRILALAPRVAYLTHFCRLDDPARHLGTLRESIRDLADLALAEESARDDQRLGRLRVAVDAYLLARARQNACELPDERVRELLAVDIELNAQGLEVWLRRRARAATRA
jgi:glyoxylase-like metal-dependent hydrolase (beta-lactamase superfamily II)